MVDFMFETGGKLGDYWTVKDCWFIPYTSLSAEEAKKVPVPFYVYGLHPDNEIGFFAKAEDEFTNILTLPKSFADLDIDSDFRKDLRRVEKKNAEVRLVFNRKEDFDVASKWFLERWSDETPDEFKRRREIWLENCSFISAYLGEELIAFHISWDFGDFVYYCGCWWNREYRNMSPPVFLLKKDIELAIENGKNSFDLGLGDEKYKKEWNPKSVPTKYYAKMVPEQAKQLEIEKFDLPEPTDNS